MEVPNRWEEGMIRRAPFCSFTPAGQAFIFLPPAGQVFIFLPPAGQVFIFLPPAGGGG